MTEPKDAEAKAEAFRELMRRFPTGVTVVTMRNGDVHHGMTANAVVSVSLDPLLFVVCVSKEARAHEHMTAAGHFVVNILSAHQEKVSRTFALKDLTDDERWSTVTSEPSELFGARRIDGCVGYLECRVVDTFEAGTHTIFLGTVERIESGVDEPPLVFHGGRYRELAPEEPPLEG